MRESFGDEMPGDVVSFVQGRSTGAGLLATFGRHVATLCRPYPAAYFALGRKCDESVDDLARRVFTTCARVPKGRFPFSGRTPFVAFVAEAFEGRAIRYHSFYAKLSIAREILRADYAHNLASDPQLAWRADLYADIGDALRAGANRVAGPGRTTRWQGGGPSLVRSDAAVTDLLRKKGTREIAVLVAEALRVGGPRTQAQLATLLEDVLGVPPSASEAVRSEPQFNADLDVVRAVRDAVRSAWEELAADEQALLRALADGLSYGEICERHPRFAHKVAVNRSVDKLSAQFVQQVLARAGGERREGTSSRELMELILDVLSELPTVEAV